MAGSARRKISRRDVAAAAGVSMTTVTYVLRRTPGTSISEPTRRRVLEAARRLGYEPDFAATSLVRGRTELVGVIAPPFNPPPNDHDAAVLAGLAAAADRTDHHLIHLDQTSPDATARCALRGYLDGIIAINSSGDIDLDVLADTGKPIVVLHEHVHIDYAGAMRRGVDYLAARRRHDVAVLMLDDPHTAPGRAFLRAFEALRDEHASTMRVSLHHPDDSRCWTRAMTALIDAGSYDGYIVNTVTARIDADPSFLFRPLVGHADVVVIGSPTQRRPVVESGIILVAPCFEAGRQLWAMLMDRIEGRAAAQAQPLAFEQA